MLSDLSPGDRLSLKGKLFELQKKLSIIDMEDKLDNQFSFKPKVIPFDLPDRSNFLDSSNKAELIRQQKKKMLVESLANQSEETCTFTPVLYTSQIQQKFEQKRAQDICPVYERLSEEGKKYAKEQQKRKKQAKLYDDDGNRLFTPSINRHSSTMAQHRFQHDVMTQSTSVSPKREERHTPMYIPPQPNTVSAEEFLYQDAKDRELRLKHLVLKYEEDAKKAANVHKINMSSEKLLKQRMERHCRHVFALFDRDNDECIVYEDVIAVMEHYPLFESTEQMIKAKELFWMVVDHHKIGQVQRVSFQDICLSFLLHKNTSSFVPSIQRLELKRIQESSNPSLAMQMSANNSSTLSTMKERELLEFKQILNKLIQFVEQKKHMERQKRTQKAHLASKAAGEHPRKGPDHFGPVPESQPPLSPSRNPPVSENQEDGENEGEGEVDHKHKLTPQSMKLAERKKQKELAMLANIYQQPAHDASKKTPTKSAGEEGNPEENAEIEPEGMDEESSQVTASMHSVSSLSHYDLMHARALLAQQKKEQLKNKIHQQEAKKYTFQPKLVTHGPKGAPSSKGNSSSEMELSMEGDVHPPPPPHDEGSSVANQSQFSSNTSPKQYVQQNVHQRLYSLGDKKSLNKKSYMPLEETLSPAYIQELQTCTFHPKIGPAPPSSFKRELVNQINGNDKNIQRVQKAHEIKMKAKEEEENEWKKQDANYRKNRDVLMKKGAKAPELKTEERMKLQRNKNSDTKLSPVKTDLIVNVKVLANKTARIRIAKGDDPLDLATRFGKIYSLDAAATQVLHSVLYQSMVQNNLIELPVVEEEAPPPPPVVEENAHRHHPRRRRSRRHSGASKRRSFIQMSAIMGASKDLDIDGEEEEDDEEDEEDDGEVGVRFSDRHHYGRYDEDDIENEELSNSDEEDYSSYTETSSLGSDEEDDEEYDEEDVGEYDEDNDVHGESESESDEEYNIHNPPDSSRSGSIDPEQEQLHAKAAKIFQTLDASPRKGKKKRSILAELL